MNQSIKYLDYSPTNTTSAKKEKPFCEGIFRKGMFSFDEGKIRRTVSCGASIHDSIDVIHFFE
jgi:hypothetical protein